MHLAALTLYPVKSLRGHPLDAAAIEARGLAGDRRWMVVDAAGRFITRRETPAMALLDAHAEEHSILLSHPELGERRVITPRSNAIMVDAIVWRDTVAVRLADAAATAFLTAALGRPARLVFQPDEGVRPIDERYAAADDQVSLADGYPILVATEASLAALNDRLATPVPMERFRPNLVIAGAQPWAEDCWRRIRVGNVILRIARACSRCVVTTQQPLTGERLEGNEPLTTLRQMDRMGKGGVMFGQNAIPERLGTIRLGDEIELLEEGDSNLHDPGRSA